MRVVLLSTSTVTPESGGMGTYTDMTYQCLRDAGADVSLLSPPPASRPDLRPSAAGAGAVNPAGNWLRLLEENIATMGAALALASSPAKKIDVVQCMDIFDVHAAVVFADWAQAPLVLVKALSEREYHRERQHGYGLMSEAEAAVRESMHKYALSVERWACHRADHLIAISTWIRNTLLDIGSELESKITIVKPAGSVPQTFVPVLAGRLRTSVVESADETVVLMPGRLSATKGVDIAIRALAQLRTPARLVIVGGGSAGYKQMLHNLCRELRVDQSVTFIDHTSMNVLQNWYAAADIVVVPSRCEAFGLVATEAMQLGRLVIASDIGGLSEQIQHGVTGLLFPTGADSSLASRIEWATANPAAASKIAQRSKSAANARLWPDVAQDTLDVYEAVLKGRRHGPVA